MLATGPASTTFDAAAALDAMLQPRTGSKGNENRRARLPPHISDDLRRWLHGATRAHAMLCHTVRVYAEPHRAGGGGNAGDEFIKRAARGCSSLLYDSVGAAIEELESVRADIQIKMDTTPEPTPHPPGSGLKVLEMAARYEAGNSLHVPGDKAANLR